MADRGQNDHGERAEGFQRSLAFMAILRQQIGA